MFPVPAAAEASPQRRITDQRTLQLWKKSESYRGVVSFISELADAVVGKKISDDCELSPVVAKVIKAFDEMGRWVAEIPPVQQRARYGNTAFRDWHLRLCARASELMGELLAFRAPDAAEAPHAADELVAYFTDSFGNPSRIDYGTGHELSLIVWFSCLSKLGLLVPADRPAAVLRAFERYLQLMRQLQTTYWLEPAGSHGVWGLDDYQFLPFLFGAAQLVDHDELRPGSIHDADLLEDYSADYLYIAAIRFIKQVKKGPFGEHSPYLNDISALANWQQVASGLVRMYEGEVLGKLPVVQHVKFGHLLPWSSSFQD